MNKNKFLLSLGSILVCSSAAISFSGQAFAKEVNAGPLYNQGDAQARCPKVCTDVGCKWTGHWRTTVPDVTSLCSCGEWTLVKKRAKFIPLTAAEQNRYDVFQNAIANKGHHPQEAARLAGDTDYKKLQGNQYEIRLSQRNRVTFTVDDKNHVVTILQAGGHTK
jgi:mRNA-degrading endonuclease RelE of RelBE toxin-antitoxin system